MYVHSNIQALVLNQAGDIVFQGPIFEDEIKTYIDLGFTVEVEPDHRQKEFTFH